MTEDLAPHEEALGEAMVPVVEYAAFELKYEAAEGVVLEPLGKYPRAAAAIAMSLAHEDDPYIRCIGALIPGHAPECDPEVLREIWQMEIQRRAASDDGVEGGLDKALVIAETDSVAERILMSAVRWLRLDEQRRACAVQVLREMVTRTIGGEHWDDAHWALSALFRDEDPQAHGLALQFVRLETGPEFFPGWARRLIAGDPQAFSAAEDLVSSADVGQHSTTLAAERRAELEALLAAAAEYEAAIE